MRSDVLNENSNSYVSFTKEQINSYEAVADAAATIAEDTSLVVFTADATSSRVITMPKAIAGRQVKFLWQVEQASDDRVMWKTQGAITALRRLKQLKDEVNGRS